MQFYAEKFVIFVLVLIRMISMFAVAPVLGNESIPTQLKIWTSAFLAYAIFPMISAGTPSISLDLGSLVLYAMQESIVGLVIGFTTVLIFHGVTYAGEIIGIDMGFSISSVIDPQNGFNVPVIGQFQYMVAIFIFLILNGHIFLLQAVKMSYSAVPIGGLNLSGMAVDRFVRITGMVFVTAIKVVAPVMISFFLADVMLGIIAKMVPQINVFFLGMPAKIGIGFFALIASLPFFVYVFGRLLDGFEQNIVELVRAM